MTSWSQNVATANAEWTLRLVEYREFVRGRVLSMNLLPTDLRTQWAVAQQFHKQRGNWTQIDRGIYRFREYLDLPSQDTDHFVRWSLWSRGRAVISHASALAVHDLGIANPAEIHLTVPSSFRQKDSAVVLHRFELADQDVEQHEGFRVTTPLRAVVETAESGADQDVIDSAIAELLAQGAASRRLLLHAAQKLGPQAELAVERALRAEAE